MYRFNGDGKYYIDVSVFLIFVNIQHYKNMNTTIQIQWYALLDY